VPVVPAVGVGAPLRVALQRGLPRRVRVRACRSFDDARTLLRRELADAVVVGTVPGWIAGATALVVDFPGIPVFAYGRFRPEDGEALAACRERGLDGVLVEGVDEPVAGELVAAHTAGRRRTRQLADGPRLLRLTEPIQRAAWDEALARVGARTTTADIARALRRSREHLSREFAAGGAPNLKRVIDLARTACAADLLASPGYDSRVVARILRFSSPGHFAATARRIADAGPSDLPRLGPRGVLQRFLRGRTRSRI
jgi:AraC-like DNA-binding protein